MLDAIAVEVVSDGRVVRGDPTQLRRFARTNQRREVLHRPDQELDIGSAALGLVAQGIHCRDDVTHDATRRGIDNRRGTGPSQGSDDLTISVDLKRRRSFPQTSSPRDLHSAAE